MQVDDHEEESVVPTCWISDNCISWPPGVDATRSIRQCRKPSKSWTRYQLVKIKFQSGMHVVICQRLVVKMNYINYIASRCIY